MNDPPDSIPMKRSKYMLIISVFICTLIVVPFILFHLPDHFEVLQFRAHIQLRDPSYFFAANFHNNEKILPNWSKEFIKVSNIIGPERVFLAIYENDSKDRTKEHLAAFSEELTQLGLKHSIITETNNLRQQYPDRIEYLAHLRNKALKPLFEFFQPASKYKNNNINDNYISSLLNSKHSKVVFMNDIYFKAIDIIRLLSTHSYEYDMACGLDFYTLFYDHFATRDIHGDWFANVFPYSREPVTQKMARQYLDFPVYSCWNGAASMTVEPFYKYGVQFRFSDLNEPCDHSECFLISEDFRRLNYTEIYVNPKVKVTYNKSDYFFHQYLTPIWEFFLALFYYPMPTYKSPDWPHYKKNHLTVACGIPPDL